jgi:hypothetical protein
MCPLLRRAPEAEESKVASTPRDERAVLNEELQRFDGIPTFGGEYKSPEGGRVEESDQIERSKPRAATSEVDLLKAELSDFMEKMETKKQKLTVQEESGVGKGVQGELRRAGKRKTSQK